MEEERYVIRYDLDYNECLIDTEENQGVGDIFKVVNLLNKQDKRIKDLEAKLAESEDCNNMLHKCLTEKEIEIETKKEENAYLKQQLAEKEKEIDRLKREIKEPEEIWNANLIELKEEVKKKLAQEFNEKINEMLKEKVEEKTIDLNN